ILVGKSRRYFEEQETATASISFHTSPGFNRIRPNIAVTIRAKFQLPHGRKDSNIRPTKENVLNGRQVAVL
ncbi:MAG TPA: hypothetical protein VK251_07055, partial [Steroidobacteraceae bacterium]|nr:hypothetical protein [Steroidobacteraceae bacterium]